MIDILLATYNGAKFLPEQLRSLEEQTYRDWRLLVRDDGSIDETCDILADFKEKHGNSVVIISDVKGRLGVCGNFNLLLSRSTASYCAFCDQDDVWLPDKLEKLFIIMRSREQRNMPLLVHSDLEVVDASLKPISRSLWSYQKLDPRNCSLERLLVQNVVTGCSSLINARLREISIPLPRGVIMHDWWIALVAAWAGGGILWCPEPLVKYRQHGQNDTGAKKWGMGYVYKNYIEFFRGRAFRVKVGIYQNQALALLNHVKGEDRGGVLQGFADMHNMSRVRRVRFLIVNGVFKTGWVRNMAMFARI